ncbi:hypothetical protein HK101_003622, partial [Irineochytrium annulatum]
AAGRLGGSWREDRVRRGDERRVRGARERREARGRRRACHRAPRCRGADVRRLATKAGRREGDGRWWWCRGCRRNEGRVHSRARGLAWGGREVEDRGGRVCDRDRRRVGNGEECTARVRSGLRQRSWGPMLVSSHFYHKVAPRVNV